MNTSEQSTPISGVDCKVSNCRYHSEANKCRAESIEVSSAKNNCSCQSETFCDTFISN